MTAPARFKQDDIARAVSGVIKGGMRPGRVEIDPNGKIVILSDTVAPAVEPNPWDTCLGKA
ncbi:MULTISPECIES: hypothetical protein [Sphingomonas]|uniref:Uncharacterized protein n=1 Tax=Sphingomonas liriopis TaxID=2949094 RepID=A0A9X2HYC2_9SPHN|nr:MULTISPECIES: hypothetical protein [Sphingomonas]MCP3735664.1 hypothetical protein [Sphingomonas liriopis]